MSRISRIPGFYKLKPEERLKLVREFAGLTKEEAEALANTGSLPLELADRMIENVIGAIPIPLGVAVNFVINGKEYLVPMAIEEPSVVAAASNAAKMALKSGGYHSECMRSVMIGQIQSVKISDPHRARMEILASKEEILAKANEQDPLLVNLGGGAIDLEARVVESRSGPMLVTHLLVDCKDAMGANAVNTMAEAVAPMIERISGGRVYLRIISNLATRRLARAWVTILKEAVGGEEVVDGIVQAYNLAHADPYRAATHNKGILNGVTAIALATCNDHRALEAGAHAYAAISGRYLPLTVWEKTEEGDLSGSLEMPMAVGVIGGATNVHPIARIALKILGVETASELGEVMAAVGLAQNLAALRALAHEGIQRGHMALHARNVAVAAGAEGDLIEILVEKMVEERKIRLDRARELLEELERR